METLIRDLFVFLFLCSGVAIYYMIFEKFDYSIDERFDFCVWEEDENDTK